MQCRVLRLALLTLALIPLSSGAEITQGADIEYETLSANKILRLMESARNAPDILILDASHISISSFSSNGAFLGSGRFHINHPPN